MPFSTNEAIALRTINACKNWRKPGQPAWRRALEDLFEDLSRVPLSELKAKIEDLLRRQAAEPVAAKDAIDAAGPPTSPVRTRGRAATRAKACAKPEPKAKVGDRLWQGRRAGVVTGITRQPHGVVYIQRDI